MADVTEETAGGVEGAASKAVHDVRGNEELHELDGHEEHPGGGRFNRLLVFVVAGISMIVGVVVVQGIRSAGVTAPSSGTQATDSGADAARNKVEVDELAAGAVRPKSPAVVIPPAASMPNVQSQVVQRTARPPGRYAQWVEDKYMKALEAPEMVGAFHSASALEIPRAQSGEGDPGGADRRYQLGSAGSGAGPGERECVRQRDRQVAVDPAGQPSYRRLSQCLGVVAAARSDCMAAAHFPKHGEHGPAADAGHRPGRVCRVRGSGEQPLPRNLRHGGGDESHQRGPNGWPDGDVRRWWNLRRLRLLPAQSVGDGGRDGRLRGVRTVGRRRAANGGTGNEPSADDRDQAGLSIRGDGD